MANVSTPALEMAPSSSSASMTDKGVIPFLACIFATVASPVLIALTANPVKTLLDVMAPRNENKVVWPLLAAMAIASTVRHRGRLDGLRWPPHIVILFAYLALAATSVLWAIKPEFTFVRSMQQAMVITSIVLPAMLAVRTADLVRGLYVCFTIAMVLNLIFVFINPPIDFKFATWGYPGYFSGKNYLGECAATAFLLALYEMRHPGSRRALAIVVAGIAITLLFMSNSKTSIGLAFSVPFLAGLTLIIARTTGISPAYLLMSIPISFIVLSTLTGFSVNRLSFMLYGDSTFTGRSIIWDFVNLEIARRPILGWGYQSFWLVGADGPSILDAPGWVKGMPNAHNGYLDTMLEMGYVGFVLLTLFVVTTLHAIGRVAERDPARAWIILSLVLFIIITNGLESWWMRGFEMLWVVFLILAAEIARYCQPVQRGPAP